MFSTFEKEYFKIYAFVYLGLIYGIDKAGVMGRMG